ISGISDCYLGGSNGNCFGKFCPPSSTGRKIETNGNNTKVEWDPTNIEFENWLASKFRNHKTMDQSTKNALWDYWRRGDDEEVITNNDLSNPRDNDSIEVNEITQIFRIDTNIFHFETSLCQAFKEFNYLSQMEVDVLTKDIPGFKTYEEFIREGNLIRYEDYEWYDTIEDSELKEEASINKKILDESMNVMEELSDEKWDRDSSIDEWKDYEHTTYIKTDVSSNQNTYNNVCQIVMDHCKTQEKQGWFDEHKLIGDDDDDICYLADYLIQKDPPYYVNEDEERSKERRCKLLGVPYVKPPTCKTEKFKTVYTAYPTSMDMTVWAAAMKLAINTRNKTGFLDGTYLKSTYANSTPLSNKWERCNSIVLSWLLNSISEELFLGQIFFDNASEVWAELKETYDKLDGLLEVARETLLDVKDAFDIISKEESQIGIASSSSGFVGHTVDRCFDIIGYPPGYNKNIGPKPNGPRTFNANSVSLSSEKGASGSFTVTSENF
ncbi:hypothetical protein Tco_0757464, partial [Tanacetum coccineum]